MLHPHDRMAISKAITNERISIRNKLQLQGTKLLNQLSKELNKVTEDFDNKDMLIAYAYAAETYVKMRTALMPEISSDGITNSLNAKAKSIKNKLT